MNRPRQVGILWLLLGVLTVGLTLPAAAEIIVRKDGREIEGHIVREDDAYVTIQTTFGTFRVRRDDIAEIKGRRAISAAEREARQAMAVGDYDQALTKFEQALEEASRPEDRRAIEQKIAEAKAEIREREAQRFQEQLETARSLIAARNFQAALAELDQLLKRNPEPSPAAEIIQEEMGKLYMAEAAYYKDQINYAEAANSYRKAIELLPDKAAPYLQMARLLQDRGSTPEEVIEYYVQGLEIARKTRQDEDLLDEYYQLGRTYLRAAGSGKKVDQEKLLEGIKCLLIVLRHDIEAYPFASSQLEDAFVKLSKTDYDADAMVKMLKSTLEINPHTHKVRSILAEVYLKKNEPRKVVEELEFIVDDATSRGEPMPEEVYYRLGLAYLGLPRPDYRQALEAFENEIRQNPLNYMALIKAAEVHTYLGNYEQSFDYCDRAIELRRERPEAYWAAGQAYLRRSLPGDTQEATRYLRRALNLKSDFHKARIRLAQIEIAEQRNSDDPDYSQATELLLKAFQGIEKIDPPLRTNEDRKVRAEAVLWLGEIESDRKNTREALKMVREAIATYPNLPEAYQLQGELHQNLENYQEAKKSFLKAVELDPRNENTYRALGILCQVYLQSYEEAIKYFQLYLDNGGTEVTKAQRWIDECKRTLSGAEPVAPATTGTLSGEEAATTVPVDAATTAPADTTLTGPADAATTASGTPGATP